MVERNKKWNAPSEHLWRESAAAGRSSSMETAADLADGDDGDAGRPRRQRCGAGGKPAASGCTDGAAGQDGRPAAARPPTLALGGRDAGEEGAVTG